MRQKEVYELDRAETSHHPEDPDAWIRRGYSAIMVGEAKDCLASFRTARKLNATIPFPAFIEAVLRAK